MPANLIILFWISRQIMIDFVLNFIFIPPSSIISDVRWWWFVLFGIVSHCQVESYLSSSPLSRLSPGIYTGGPLSIVSSQYFCKLENVDDQNLLVNIVNNIHHYELIQFQSKSLAVWTLNSIKENLKTTSPPRLQSDDGPELESLS